jgi:hypothetical protein
MCSVQPSFLVQGPLPGMSMCTVSQGFFKALVAPVRMMTPTDGSSLASEKQRDISCTAAQQVCHL